MQVLVCARNELVFLLCARSDLVCARSDLVSLLCARSDLVCARSDLVSLLCARSDLVSLLCASLLNGRNMLGRLSRVDLLNSDLPDDYTLVFNGCDSVANSKNWGSVGISKS